MPQIGQVDGGAQLMSDSAPGRRRFAALPLAAMSNPKLHARDLRVLIAICMSVDPKDGNRARPGVSKIAERTGIDRDKISELVKRLEAERILKVERRPGGLSVYTVIYDYDGEGVPAHGDGDGPQVSPPTGVPAEGDSPRPRVSPPTDLGVPAHGGQVSPPTGTKQTLRAERRAEREHAPSHPLGAGAGPAANDDGFEETWSEWPRKLAKGSARKAYRSALKKASGATILLGVRRFAEQAQQAGTEARFIPHLATWLRAERWQDEPEPSRPAAGGFAAALGELRSGGHRRPSSSIGTFTAAAGFTRGHDGER